MLQVSLALSALLAQAPAPAASPPAAPGLPSAEPRTAVSGQPVLELSVNDALELALRASDQVDIAAAGVARSRGNSLQAKSEWYPQLIASASYERTLASEFADLFTAPTGTSAPAGASDVPLELLPFGQANIWRLGLSASLNLFAGGGTLARNRLAAAGTELAGIGLRSARAQAVLAAAEAYFNAVLAAQLHEIAEATVQQAKQTYEYTRLGRGLGTQPEFDQLRAQFTYETQRAAADQRRMERHLARMRLQQLLDLPPDREVRLTTSLDGQLPQLPEQARRAAGVGADPQTGRRAPVRQAEQGVRLSEAAVSAAFSQHWPSLTLATNLGPVSYPAGAFPARDDWRLNWVAGLYLQVPLFTGFRIHGAVVAARADLTEARARLRLTEELTKLDTQTAIEQLATARAQWQAVSGTVVQARRAYEIAELRYSEGISTQLELADARILYQQAAANRARAARDLQVAALRVNLLPELPLGTVTQVATAVASGGSLPAGTTATGSAPSAGTGPGPSETGAPPGASGGLSPGGTGQIGPLQGF